MELKELLFERCSIFIENRINAIQGTIIEIQGALLEETKSSAGDKHETGRAMLQLEREKLGQQLSEAQIIKLKLDKIQPKTISKIVVLGSVVFSSQANYFIAISAGQQVINSDTFYAISTQTPIGQLLLSKKAGDTVIFRGQKITLTKII